MILNHCKTIRSVSISNQLPTPLLPRNVPSTVNIPQAQSLAEVFP